MAQPNQLFGFLIDNTVVHLYPDLRISLHRKMFSFHHEDNNQKLLNKYRYYVRIVLLLISKIESLKGHQYKHRYQINFGKYSFETMLWVWILKLDYYSSIHLPNNHFRNSSIQLVLNLYLLPYFYH